MTTKITSISDISLSPAGLENAVVVETDGDLQLKRDARLPNNQSLIWRNAANDADISLVTDGSNNLKYNSLTLVSGSLGLIPLTAIENGGGGGGGSGFTLALVSTAFTAATNTQYLVDTSVSAFTGTLPVGADQFSIKFSDDQRNWGINPFTIQPAAGQKIDGFLVDEPLICDLTGASVLLSWDGLKWVIDSNVVLGGTSNTGSSSAMSAEKNYVTKPDNANTDWISSNIALVTVATDSISANLPEAATKTTAIRITRVSGTTGYVRYRFVADPADLGKKFKLHFNQKYGGNAGDYTIEMWSFSASNYTTGPLQLAIQNSSIPQAVNSGTFSTTFDTGTNKYIELRIVAAAGTTPIYLSGVLVGPGILVQGAVIGPLVSFSPSFPSGTPGVTPTARAEYQQLSNGLKIECSIFFSGTGTGVGSFTMALPISGITAVAGQYGGATWKYANSGTDEATRNGFVIGDGSGNLTFSEVNTPATAMTTNGLGGATAQRSYLVFSVTIPIREWDGTGTVNLINQNTQSPIRAGTIQAFAGSVTPTGWLDCDGTAKLITDYPQLYAQIGAAWATCTNPLTGSAYSAPAAGSFRVPDLRGAFIRGAGGPNAAGVTTTLAGYQADTTAVNGLLNVANTLQSGSAAATGSATLTNHAHGPNINLFALKGGAAEAYGSAAATGYILSSSSSTAAVNIDHSHTVTGNIPAQGMNGNPETRPDNVGVRMIIKAWDESFNLAGFAQATATNLGLVSGGKLPGSDGSVANGTGMIGEVVDLIGNWAGTALTANADIFINNITTQPLGIGIWDVFFYGQTMSTNTGTAAVECGLFTGATVGGGTAVPLAFKINPVPTTTAAGRDTNVRSEMAYLRVTTPVLFSVFIRSNGAANTLYASSTTGGVRAIRRG